MASWTQLGSGFQPHPCAALPAAVVLGLQRGTQLALRLMPRPVEHVGLEIPKHRFGRHDLGAPAGLLIVGRPCDYCVVRRSSSAFRAALAASRMVSAASLEDESTV